MDGSESRRLAGGEVEVDGRLNLDELAEVSGVELPDGPYATLGGWVMFALGRLPQAGDVVEHEGTRVTVLRLDGRRVARVRVTPPVEAQDVPAVQ